MEKGDSVEYTNWFHSSRRWSWQNNRNHLSGLSVEAYRDVFIGVLYFSIVTYKNR